MITGKTATGFEYTIDDDAMDDYELLESLVKVDRGDVSCITDAINHLLGENEKKRLIEHVRAKSGRASAKSMVAEFREIMNAAGAKNS